jgi:hypothetical protein
MSHWEEGDRVLAPWEPDWLYPGTIRCIDDDVAFIKFDDGDRRLAPLNELQSIEIKEGTRVFSRVNQGAKMYYPAKVIECLGEDIQVRFDDGREERTTISYIRVPRKKGRFEAWHN